MRQPSCQKRWFRRSLALALAAWSLSACARSLDAGVSTAHLLCRDLVALGMPCRPEGAAIRVHSAHLADAQRITDALYGAAGLLNADVDTPPAGAGPAAFRATRQREDCDGLMESGDIWACGAGGSGRIIFVGPSGLTNELPAHDEVRAIPLPAIRAVGLRPIGPFMVAGPHHPWVRFLCGMAGALLGFAGIQRWKSAGFSA
jgi:hypothetical protein